MKAFPNIVQEAPQRAIPARTPRYSWPPGLENVQLRGTGLKIQIHWICWHELNTLQSNETTSYLDWCFYGVRLLNDGCA